MADKFTELSDARGRFVLLYDKLLEGRTCDEECEYIPKLKRAANEVWQLMTGDKDMPPVIELCLPEWHKEHLSPNALYYVQSEEWKKKYLKGDIV